MSPEQAKKMVYSPTSLMRYASCPASWSRHYVDGERGTDSPVFAFGSLFHLIMESYNKSCQLKGTPSDPDAMLGFVDGHWFQQTAVPPERYREMRDLCARTAFGQVLDLDALVDVETMYHMTINDHLFRAKPDLVFVRGNAGYVPDYKTGWQMPSDDEIKASFQFRCYAAVVLDEYEQLDCCKVAVKCPRIGKTSEPHTYWRDQLDDLKDEIWKRIEQAEADMEYRHTPGSYCDVCEFKGTCDAMTKALVNAGNDVGPVVRDDQAADLVAEAVLLTRHLKDVKAALKPYSINHGAVRSSDMAFGPRELVSTKYPSREMAALFEGSEVDPWTFLKIDSRELTRALKQEKHLRDEVDKLAFVETRTRTDLHKIPVGEDS